MLVSQLLPGFTPFLIPGLEAADAPEASGEAALVPVFLPRFEEISRHPDGCVSRPAEALIALPGDTPSAPPDRGALRRDAIEWQRTHGRTADDAGRVKILGARIRLALWEAMSAGDPTDVSRAAAKGERIFVRISPTGDGLDQYDLALSAGLLPFLSAAQAIWSLNLRTGELEPIPGASPAPAGVFAPYYRSIHFRFTGLNTAPLVEALPAERRRALASPVPRPQTSVVLHYDAIRAALMRRVIAYAEQWALGDESRHYLISLADTILRLLRARELEDPRRSREPALHVWIRGYETTPSEANVEIGPPGRFIGQTPGPRDLLFVLIRYDPQNTSLRPYLRVDIDFTPQGRMPWYVKSPNLLPFHLQIEDIDEIHPDFEPR